MSRGTDITDMRRTYRTVTEGEFANTFSDTLQLEASLRYGENPNQPGAIYRLQIPMGGVSFAELTDIRLAKSGKGGLSATNLMDVTRALEILKFFSKPSVAVMKHLVPSGFATQYEGNNLDQIYRNARDTDARSAFGSIVVSNRSIDMATAENMISTFVEGVAAPEFEEGVMGILEKKKDLRVIRYGNLDKIPKFLGDDTKGVYDFKTLPTGRVLVQQPYLSSILSAADLVTDPLVTAKDGTSVVVERDPATQELEDMLTSWYVNLGVRSNGIVFVKDGVTVAIGSGQQERVGAVEQAMVKAWQKAMDREGIEYDALDGARGREQLQVNPLEGAVMSSDGFIPFRDSIDTIARGGVTGIVQPGGSRNDHETIQAVNDHNMSMAFTLERCFGHF